VIETAWLLKHCFSGDGAMRIKTIFIFLLMLGTFLIVSACKEEGAQTEVKPEIDLRSYNLGVIGAFSEVVSLGIKKLALSAPLEPEEMDLLLKEAKKIAANNGVSIYLEEDFLVTDLFPEEVTSGKHVLLIYSDPVKDEYLQLKSEKEELVKIGLYQDKARLEIARKMGRLLSYPEERITLMLTKTLK
jgi:hypothetical protein